MVIFKQVFPIAVAMMIYLHTANTFRDIQVLFTVKTCKGVTSSFSYHGNKHRLIVK